MPPMMLPIITPVGTDFLVAVLLDVESELMGEFGDGMFPASELEDRAVVVPVTEPTEVGGDTATEDGVGDVGLSGAESETGGSISTCLHQSGMFKPFKVT